MGLEAIIADILFRRKMEGCKIVACLINIILHKNPKHLLQRKNWKMIQIVTLLRPRNIGFNSLLLCMLPLDLTGAEQLFGGVETQC